jgi:predicted dehydrogenase
VSEKIKIGLIGAGDIGSVHAEAWAKLGDVTLCLAAGRNRERAKTICSEVGATLYESVDAMLGDPAIQGVDICVPNPLHREFSERAYAAGKHVMCEKPIALTLEDADAMMTAADRAKKILFIAHVLRFWPDYARAREWAAEEGLGNMVLITARRFVSVLEATPGTDRWRHDPAMSGGAVIDLQIHDIDWFNWVLGDPVRVDSRGVQSPDGAISHVWTSVEYACGARAFVEGSFMFKGNPMVMDFRMLSKEASVEFTYAPTDFALGDMEGKEGDASGGTLNLYRWGEEPVALYTPPEDPFPAAMQAQVAHFADCIREGADGLAVRPEEARRALEVCIASERSCNEGRPIEM